MSVLLHDLRSAWRQVFRTPLASLSFIVTVALAVGVNTLPFTVLNAALLKPPPVADIDTLVFARWPGFCEGGQCDLRDSWFDRADAPFATVEHVSAFSQFNASIATADRNGIVAIQSVWRDYFAVLGIRPVAGRLLDRRDDVAGAADVAVVSERLWRSWMQSRAGAVGERIVVGGHTLVVVGVVPAVFRGVDGAGPVGVDVWVPWRVPSAKLGQTFVARLKPGAAFDAAAAEVRARTIGLDVREPDRFLELRRLADGDAEYPTKLYALLALVLAPPMLILIIAAGNLAALLFSKFTHRLGEIATRVMLGASERHVARLLGTEVGLLTLCGGGLGLWMAVACARLITWPELSGLTVSLDLSPDWRVFTYALAATCGIGLLVAGMVGRRVTRVDALVLMAATSGAGTSATRRSPARTALIAAQAACSVTMLVVAGLFIKSAWLGLIPDANMDVSRSVAARLSHQLQGDDDVRAAEVNRVLIATASRIPGVTHVALLSALPGTRVGIVRVFPDPQTAGPDVSVRAGAISATPGFVDAVGVRLLQGRRFNDHDTADSEPVMIVSQIAADRFWPGEAAVGRLVTFAGERGAAGPPHRVIGVVSSRTGDALDRSVGRDIYVPLAQRPAQALTLVARGASNERVLAAQLTTAVSRNLPQLTLFDVGTLADTLGAGAVGLRWAGSLLAGIGLLGAGLAAIGLFGVVAHGTSMRRRDFGIMRALGASDAHLYGQTMRGSMRALLLGTIPGVLMALLAARALRYYFLGLHWFDWLTFVAVPAGVLIVGALACLLAARFALGKAPLAALRDL